MKRTDALDLVVVDDNPVLVSVLSQICAECGHSVRLSQRLRTEYPTFSFQTYTCLGCQGTSFSLWFVATFRLFA